MSILPNRIACLRILTPMRTSPLRYSSCKVEPLRHRQSQTYSFSSTSAAAASDPPNPYAPSPAPPHLPKEEQELFERLQREAARPSLRETAPAPSDPDADFSAAADTAIADTDAAEADRRRAMRANMVKQSPYSAGEADAASTAGAASAGDEADASDGWEAGVQVDAEAEGAELHPHVRRGARPEFVGERNPKTGEVGGPKNEPLRWGSAGDWSYNGRVTDF